MQPMRYAMVLLLLTACATAPTAQDSIAEVQRASDQYFATRERGDVAALASHVTDDVVFMVPGLADATGRDKFREVMQQRLANVRITDFKIEQREIKVAGDTAHELGWFSEANRGEEQSFQMAGRYIIVWKRGNDGVWRVQRHMYNFSDASPLT